MSTTSPSRIHVAIAYHSGYGKTAVQASAVADGARSVDGTLVTVHDVSAMEAADWDALDAADAIVFGSPTYFGGASAAFRAFAEASVGAWADGPRWKDKLAAGFTNSKTMSGDKLQTLVSMAILAAQHGMLWVGVDLYPGWHTSNGSPGELNRLGSWLGAMAQSDSDQPAGVVPPSSDLRTAAHLGRRVSLVARQLAHGRLATAAAA